MLYGCAASLCSNPQSHHPGPCCVLQIELALEAGLTELGSKDGAASRRAERAVRLGRNFSLACVLPGVGSSSLCSFSLQGWGCLIEGQAHGAFCSLAIVAWHVCAVRKSLSPQACLSWWWRGGAYTEHVCGCESMMKEGLRCTLADAWMGEHLPAQRDRRRAEKSMPAPIATWDASRRVLHASMPARLAAYCANLALGLVYVRDAAQREQARAAYKHASPRCSMLCKCSACACMCAGCCTARAGACGSCSCQGRGEGLCEGLCNLYPQRPALRLRVCPLLGLFLRSTEWLRAMCTTPSACLLALSLAPLKKAKADNCVLALPVDLAFRNPRLLRRESRRHRAKAAEQDAKAAGFSGYQRRACFTPDALLQKAKAAEKNAKAAGFSNVKELQKSKQVFKVKSAQRPATNCKHTLFLWLSTFSAAGFGAGMLLRLPASLRYKWPACIPACMTQPSSATH
eukprot:1159432-Pelagomonas_calceolata.AAC.1